MEIAGKFGLDRGAYHELGCAFGGTVFEVASRGVRATGTDLNASAIEQGRKRGANVQTGNDAEFLATLKVKPNVIYGYHMLEHVPNPVEYLRGIAGQMARDSVAIFFVPNAIAAFPMVYNYMRYVWYGYPEHPHMFSPHSLLCLGRATGFDLIHVATNPIPIKTEETGRIVQPLPGSPTAEAIRDHAMREALLLPELEFVFARTGSTIATRFKDAASAAGDRCRRSADFEKAMGELMKTTDTPDPTQSA
jgi:SAM-dependent methyltransferase